MKFSFSECRKKLFKKKLCCSEKASISTDDSNMDWYNKNSDEFIKIALITKLNAIENICNKKVVKNPATIDQACLKSMALEILNIIRDK